MMQKLFLTRASVNVVNPSIDTTCYLSSRLFYKAHLQINKDYLENLAFGSEVNQIFNRETV